MAATRSSSQGRKCPTPSTALPKWLVFVYRYWAVLFMLLCIAAVSLLPLEQEKGVFVQPSEEDSVFAFLSSFPLLTSVSWTILALGWALTRQNLTEDNTEVMAMVWHLTNGTWWSLACDSWSGLFKIMPRMRKLYLILDTKHGVNWKDQTQTPPWSPNQSSLESVYWAETMVHVPLALLTFYLYATRNPNRYLAEAFLGGVQLVGCFGYYGPELLIYLHGFETTWPDNRVIWWLGIGCVPLVWMIVPILLTLRAAKLQAQMNYKGGEKLKV